MLKKLSLIYFLSVLTVTGCFGADHIALSLKNKGMKKLLVSVLSHYRNGNNKSIVILPENDFMGSISKDNLNNNPLMKKLKEYMEFDLGEDLNFHVRWTPITVEAKLADEDVKINTFGVGRSFKALFRTNISELLIKGKKIEFCEFLDDKNNCNEVDGLSGYFENFELSLKPGEVIHSLIETHVKVADEKVEIKFSKLVSNLTSKKSIDEQRLLDKFNINEKAPEFNLSFENFEMPPPVINVSGTEIELDITDIKSALLSESEFLANVLTDFAGKFIAQDLVTIINEKVVSKLDDIKTKYKLVDYDSYQVRSKRFLELMNVDTKEALLFLKGEGQNEDSSFFAVLNRVFSEKIRKAKNELIFSHIRTQKSQDLSTYFNTNLFINDKKVKVGTNVWNNQKKLKRINFNNIKSDYSFAFAVSEPLINSILNTGVNTGVLNNLFQEFADMKGVYIDGLNLHFISNQKTCELDKIKVVVNMRVRMSQLERVSWADHFKLAIGEYIESDGVFLTKENDLIFPVEIDFSSVINENNGQTEISLVAESPFTENGLKNTFEYPYRKMSKTVENSLLEKLRDSLSEHLNTVQRIDISNYVNAVPGLTLKPKRLFSTDSGHLVLTFDIEDIDLVKLGAIGES